jgi:hypothetical protein
LSDSLLGKKILRNEELQNLIANSINKGINNIDHMNLKAKLEINQREMRQIIKANKINKRELELFAPYVQSGKRIPRRGEVGLSSDAIENFEKLGYVMSGSRHKKMTSAREMKEMQIFSVEEKKALAIFNLEEQQRKETSIINNFKKILMGKKGNEKDEDGFYKDFDDNKNL